MIRIADATYLHDLKGIPIARPSDSGPHDIGVEHQPACALSRYSFVHAVLNERDIQMSLKQCCVLFVLACTLSGAGVASAADLSVSGQIRAVSACSIALGNGGVVNLGTISSKGFQGSAFAVDSNISLGIQCQAPTKVAFLFLDNRAGTSTQHNMFGLGSSGGKNVGVIALTLKEIFGDDAKLTHLVSWYGSNGWAQGWGDIKAEGLLLSSWAEPGQSLPQAFQSISGELNVHSRIDHQDLDLSQEIAIDGSITMELVYL